MRERLRPGREVEQAPRGSAFALGAAALALIALVAFALVEGPGHLNAFTAWVVDVQRDLHRQLAAAVHAVRDAGPAAAWPLVALSFAYGVFHAAGPGHGKVVIATYVTTQESRLPQALALTAAASLAQAFTAIAGVAVAVTLLGLGLRQARGDVMELELLSFALVAALGCFLAVRAGLALRRAPTGEACDACGGHHHAPPVSKGGWWAALGVVASIGMRPCAGALVILLLAHAGGLPWIGAGAVVAMAVGTALTTGALAALSVLARRTALTLAAALPGGRGRTARLTAMAALIGGLVLLALGLLLLQAAWTTPAHPFR